MRPKRYAAKPDQPEPDDLPPIPFYPRWKVYVRNRAGQHAGFFVVEALSAEEALHKVQEGEYGLGWIPFKAEPA